MSQQLQQGPLPHHRLFNIGCLFVWIIVCVCVCVCVCICMCVHMCTQTHMHVGVWEGKCVHLLYGCT